MHAECCNTTRRVLQDNTIYVVIQHYLFNDPIEYQSFKVKFYICSIPMCQTQY